MHISYSMKIGICGILTIEKTVHQSLSEGDLAKYIGLLIILETIYLTTI